MVGTHCFMVDPENWSFYIVSGVCLGGGGREVRGRLSVNRDV